MSQMEDGLRHRPSTPLSESELEDESPVVVPEKLDLIEDMRTSCKWCPLLASVWVLVYFHGIALGWYLCSK